MKTPLSWLAPVCVGVALSGLVLYPGLHATSQDLNEVEFARLVASGGHRLGSNEARRIVLVFSDYGCNWCRMLHQTIEQLLVRHDGEVAVVMRHYVDPDQEDALQLALGAECAAAQGVFEAYHRAAFANARVYSYWNGVAIVADSAGIGAKGELLECVTTRRFAEEIQRDWQLAKDLYVDATPTLFVNGRRVVGAAPLEVLEELLGLTTER